MVVDQSKASGTGNRTIKELTRSSRSCAADEKQLQVRMDEVEHDEKARKEHNKKHAGIIQPVADLECDKSSNTCPLGRKSSKDHKCNLDMGFWNDTLTSTKSLPPKKIPSRLPLPTQLHPANKHQRARNLS